MSIIKAKIIAAEIAARIHCDRSGSCLIFAELFTLALVDHNITNFHVIEGCVQPVSHVNKLTHTWIEISGEKIDPTFIQFYVHGKVNYMHKVYGRYNPSTYMFMIRHNPLLREEFNSFIKENDNSHS